MLVLASYGPEKTRALLLIYLTPARRPMQHWWRHRLHAQGLAYNHQSVDNQIYVGYCLPALPCDLRVRDIAKYTCWFGTCPFACVYLKRVLSPHEFLEEFLPRLIIANDENAFGTDIEGNGLSSSHCYISV